MKQETKNGMSVLLARYRAIPDGPSGTTGRQGVVDQLEILVDGAIRAHAADVEKERDLLSEEMEDADQTRARLAELLTGVANALKGPPGPLTLHDWSDLPALAADRARIVDAVAKCDPVYDNECALCGVGGLDRFNDGPEKHATDCPWRLARVAQDTKVRVATDALAAFHLFGCKALSGRNGVGDDSRCDCKDERDAALASLLDARGKRNP